MSGQKNLMKVFQKAFRTMENDAGAFPPMPYVTDERGSRDPVFVDMLTYGEVLMAYLADVNDASAVRKLFAYIKESGRVPLIEWLLQDAGADGNGWLVDTAGGRYGYAADEDDGNDYSSPATPDEYATALGADQQPRLVSFVRALVTTFHVKSADGQVDLAIQTFVSKIKPLFKADTTQGVGHVLSCFKVLTFGWRTHPASSPSCSRCRRASSAARS